jgi:hypothetical protein
MSTIVIQELANNTIMIQGLRMNIITKFINRMQFSDQIKVLGRWEITYCKPTMNKKIDLANEDHCGICYSTKYHNHHHKYVTTHKKYNNPIIDLE